MEKEELIPDINIDEEIRKLQEEEKNNLSEEEVKEIKYCIDIWKKGIGYDNPRVYVEPFEKLLNLYNKAQAKLTEYEKQLDLDYVEENYVSKELYEQEKEIRIKEAVVISRLRQENQNLKEKLKMYIPRRRVRRVYKMLGKILRTDVDPVILEKELKEGENK